ncbi:uncharacterized protein BJ212DRAFT_1590429 [Suillus subaureus]|uniref:Uncharacterized protein n=1 Tax=Suillus subaureus TaxID=48587 RepID=A0A9P7J898_9AGAM|nr:uncharacterized protein BJ212DRAFT_1590429 [Suillus subaureus]KAG1807509.1 hypothetical protein BJ212DRAFT_1590429 [Suillus subaureus]
MVNTKASDDILVIPVSVQSIILPDQNLSVSSLLRFSLPSASTTTAPPLCKYFSTDSPPKDSSYLNYLRTQSLPKLAVLHQLLEGAQHEQEEILEDEEDTWLDETLAAKPAEDSAFDIEVDANLHAPIVTKALSDECEESPINSLGSTQGDATEDDADLEGMDTEWDGFW